MRKLMVAGALLAAACAPIDEDGQSLELTGERGSGEDEEVELVGVKQAQRDNTFSVGVVSVDGCAADSDQVTFVLDVEDSNTWFASSGWAEPSAAKPPVRGSGSTKKVWLSFCRADGTLFRPLTASAHDADSFYAVLKLGTHCPAGSSERWVTFFTETDDNEDRIIGYGDPSWEGGAATNFAFCVFTNADSSSQTMASFPPLGMNYGVLHDFDGGQPWWVKRKLAVFLDGDDGWPREQGPCSNPWVCAALDKSFEPTPARDRWFEAAQVLPWGIRL